MDYIPNLSLSSPCTLSMMHNSYQSCSIRTFYSSHSLIITVLNFHTPKKHHNFYLSHLIDSILCIILLIYHIIYFLQSLCITVLINDTPYPPLSLSLSLSFSITPSAHHTLHQTEYPPHSLCSIMHINHTTYIAHSLSTTFLIHHIQYLPHFQWITPHIYHALNFSTL